MSGRTHVLFLDSNGNPAYRANVTRDFISICTQTILRKQSHTAEAKNKKNEVLHAQVTGLYVVKQGSSITFSQGAKIIGNKMCGGHRLKTKLKNRIYC